MLENVKKLRKVGKAAVLPTAPAYTWGKARDKPLVDPGPGPGEYDPTTALFPRGVGFGSSTRDQRGADATPSPGDYKQDPSPVLKSSPGFSFRTKSVPGHLKSKTPGPGQYNPERGWAAVKPGKAAYSLAARPASGGESTSTPGPNMYNAMEYRVKEGHGATLKFRHSVGACEGSTPGPLDYADAHFQRPKSEGKSFGTSREVLNLSNGMPGPGHYQQDVAAVRKRPKSWSMPRSMRDKVPDGGVPGPGTYLHQPVIERDGGHAVRSELRSAPAYSVAGRPYKSAEQEIPGPSDYGVPKDPMRRSQPAFSFRGVQSREGRNTSPGPGTYEAGVRSSTPAFSMAARTDDGGLKDRNPGPCDYNLKLDSKPGVSLKFRHPIQNQDPGPSPLDYADKDFRQIYCPGGSRKGITFGIKPKSRAIDPVPGPIYQVGCTTLGIAAATPMTQKEINQIAVL